MKHCMRVILCTMIALSPISLLHAQAGVVQRRGDNQAYVAHRALPVDTAVKGMSLKSRTTGALIGGFTGLAVGLVLGHEANIGCRLGDSKCNPKNKQTKAMIVTGVMLGALGAGAGYLIGKVWPHEP